MSKPASEAQLNYLADLLTPARLEGMDAAEARALISLLRGPWPNSSPAQRTYLLNLLEKLSREELRALLSDLAARVQAAGGPDTGAGQGSKPEGRQTSAPAAPAPRPRLTWTPPPALVEQGPDPEGMF